MATTVVHEGDASVFYRGKGIRSTKKKQRWIQLVIRTDTNLPCLNICKMNNHRTVKETVALYKDSTRVSTLYMRSCGGSSTRSAREYVFTVTAVSADMDREYTFKTASLYQLEQWMSRLKQAIFTDKNWFSCQCRVDGTADDQDVLLDLNQQTCHMTVVDPLVSSHSSSSGQAHNLLQVTEFGAERDHITLYFIKCGKCAGSEEVFLRTSTNNVNTILSQVEMTLEHALGESKVDRVPSSRCGYMVQHICQASPPVGNRLPAATPGRREKRALPCDLADDIRRDQKPRLPDSGRKRPVSRSDPPPHQKPPPLPPLESTMPRSYEQRNIVDERIACAPSPGMRRSNESSGGSSGSTVNNAAASPRIPASPRPPYRVGSRETSGGSTSEGESPLLPPIGSQRMGKAAVPPTSSRPWQGGMPNSRLPSIDSPDAGSGRLPMSLPGSMGPGSLGRQYGGAATPPVLGRQFPTPPLSRPPANYHHQQHHHQETNHQPPPPSLPKLRTSVPNGMDIHSLPPPPPSNELPTYPSDSPGSYPRSKGRMPQNSFPNSRSYLA